MNMEILYSLRNMMRYTGAKEDCQPIKLGGGYKQRNSLTKINALSVMQSIN
jgi:hypothetical protein